MVTWEGGSQQPLPAHCAGRKQPIAPSDERERGQEAVRARVEKRSITTHLRKSNTAKRRHSESAVTKCRGQESQKAYKS